MKDIEYGLFAQVTYYNWYNYSFSGEQIRNILNDKNVMEVLLDGKSESFKNENEEIEIELSNGNTAKIYNEQDKRLLMMYSEDKERPDINQKYKSLFEGWEC